MAQATVTKKPLKKIIDFSRSVIDFDFPTELIFVARTRNLFTDRPKYSEWSLEIICFSLWIINQEEGFKAKLRSKWVIDWGSNKANGPKLQLQLFWKWYFHKDYLLGSCFQRQRNWNLD